MTYTETVEMPLKEYEKINRLLSINSMEEMTDEQLLNMGANTDVCIGVFGVKFDDGSTLTYDLCSGTTNYWDDVVWSKDGYDTVLECTFELDDIEFEIDENTYIVKIKTIK